MYAIQNQKTHKFVFGTDYRFLPPKQKTSVNRMLTYEDLFQVQSDFLSRKCWKDYKIVILKKPEVQKIIEPPSSYLECAWGFDSEEESNE